ncbi:MAG: dihydroorotase [Chitinophagales bacterium]
MKLLVKGGRILDPANDVDMIGDILVEDGIIKEVGAKISARGAEVVDAAGCLVCPGFIDMHVHLREPGYEYKEDIASGTRAAAAGGFTTVCCMPNTNPVCDNKAVAEYIKKTNWVHGLINVHPIGSITKGQKGTEISEMGDLVQAGCVAVSDDGRPVMNSEIMRRALEYSKMFDLPVISHCEELSLAEDGQMHEGFYSTLYGLKGIPAAAEEIMVVRDIILARTTGGRLHFAHLSTKGSLELVRQAKKEGLRVTCEVTPHHLTLTDEIVGEYDASSKVNPPLRSKEHLQALIEGLKDGTIDCLASDHAPHELEAKDCEYNLASNGISGLETAVPVIFTELVNTGLVDVTTVVKAWTTGPARVLDLDRGSLSVGWPADITIIDPARQREVNPDEFYSKGKNNPYKGRVLTGWPVVTIVTGEIVARDGKVIG